MYVCISQIHRIMSYKSQFKLISLITPQVNDLHLNDPECRGVEIEDDYVFSIKTNLTDCGTIMVNLIRVLDKMVECV